MACAVYLGVRDSALGCHGPMRVVSQVCIANQVLHSRLIKIVSDEVLAHQDELTISVTRLSVLHETMGLSIIIPFCSQRHAVHLPCSCICLLLFNAQDQEVVKRWKSICMVAQDARTLIATTTGQWCPNPSD